MGRTMAICQMRSLPVILELLQLKFNCPFFWRDFLATSSTDCQHCLPSHLPRDFTAPAPPSTGGIQKRGQLSSSPSFVISHPFVHKPIIYSSAVNTPYAFLAAGLFRRPCVNTLYSTDATRWCLLGSSSWPPFTGSVSAEQQRSLAFVWLRAELHCSSSRHPQHSREYRAVGASPHTRALLWDKEPQLAFANITR